MKIGYYCIRCAAHVGRPEPEPPEPSEPALSKRESRQYTNCFYTLYAGSSSLCLAQDANVGSEITCYNYGGSMRESLIELEISAGLRRHFTTWVTHGIM
jgi:hypothetical protein